MNIVIAPSCCKNGFSVLHTMCVKDNIKATVCVCVPLS